MDLRREEIRFPLEKKFRILHLSDVHFSRRTSPEQNAHVTQEIVTLCRQCRQADAICMTGDLVSRHFVPESLRDAAALMQQLCRMAPVYYAFGNHEMDWEPDERSGFARKLEATGVIVLDNKSVSVQGITFAGLTLPQTVYKNRNGHYWHLEPIRAELLRRCIGTCPAHPCVLLAHTPLGLPAYAEWGADLVLSGHVHGGIVRVGNTGLLSPERRFLPRFTKGIYREGNCVMNVSAGIGKFRIHNPAEVVCLEWGG